jgi:hypothetical protein
VHRQQTILMRLVRLQLLQRRLLVALLLLLLLLLPRQERA